MAIRMISGVPGSGKSYYTTQEIILKNLKNGRKVITNIPLNIDYLVEVLDISPELIKVIESKKGDYSDTFYDVEDYKDSWRNKNGQAPVVVVDEAHFALSKTRRKDEVVAIENFFSTHRQAGYDIYLITQDPKRIPKDVLGFVDTYYKIKKQRKITSKIFTVFIYDNSNNLLGEKTSSYKKDIFKCYKSHLLSNQSVEEDTSTVGVKTFWQSNLFISFIVVLVLFIGFVFSGHFNLNVNKIMEVKKPSTTLKTNIDTTTLVDIKPLKNDIKHADIVDLNKKDNAKTIEITKNYYNQFHPLEDKFLQIKTKIGKDIIFSIFNKDKENVGTITNTSLKNMGYDLNIYSSCSVELKYKSISFFVDCSEIKTDNKEKPADTINIFKK